MKSSGGGLLNRYRLRLRRRRLLLRALFKSRQLKKICVASAPRDGVIVFVTLRNEMARLPYFLEHHRALGVGAFYVVDNNSDDGSAEYLQAQDDVHLWHAASSYRRAGFGMDWLNYLLLRHGQGKWCLTLDADEALIYPHMETQDLSALTRWLDENERESFSTTMLDLYPEDAIGDVEYTSGQAFTDALPFYDPGPYPKERHPRFGNVSIRGGVRQRVFFSETPELAPHLHKTPLIKWHWRFAYASSTHIALPTRLNAGLEDGSKSPTGVLAHSKFLPEVVEKSGIEKLRGEHFTAPTAFDGYYAAIQSDLVLKYAHSERFEGWKKLERDGLLSRGDWAISEQ